MKSSLIATLVLVAIPIFAACPVENASSCSIASEAATMPSSGMDLLQPFSTTSIQDVTTKMQSNFNPTPHETFEDLQKEDKKEVERRPFRQSSGDFSYNSSCQFGVCQQTGTPRLFQQR